MHSKVLQNMLSKKLAGSALVFAVLISCYVGIVEIVNVFASPEVIREFSVESLRNHGSACQFVMSDNLVVEAFSDLADVYALEIYLDSVLIFKKEGGFDGSKAEIHVPLVSPAFGAGNGYVLVLHAYAYNRPILGVHFSDYKSYAFEAVGVRAKLDLSVDYNESWRSLSLCANLTDVAGYPVVNETVDFSVQYCGRQRATNGWVPIGSAVSNASGLAPFGLVFNVRAGTYFVKAFHAEGVDFGEAECVKTVNVSSVEGFGGNESSGFGGVLSDGGNVTIELSSTQPYAVLPFNVTATYESSIPLEGYYKVMIFWWHGIGSVWCVGVGWLTLVSSPNPYVYRTFLTWEPNVTGYDWFIGGVFACNDIRDINPVKENGEGVVAFGLAALDIQCCPLNLVVSYPEATYGDEVPVTVCVSEPRSYTEGHTDFSVTRTLGPMINYSGVTYAVDEPLANHAVKLLVNETLLASNLTDNDGLVEFSVDSNSSTSCFVWNLTVAVDESLYERKSVERFVNLSKVKVSEVVTASNSSFLLNYTLGGLSENKSLYVGVNTTLTVTASLFDYPVKACPASMVVARSLEVWNRSSECIIPSDANYSRIVKLYESLELGQRVKATFGSPDAFYPDSKGCIWIPSWGHTMYLFEEPFFGDVNGDGKVDGKDIAIVSKAYNTRPGDPNWDARADLNGDLKVDGKDLAIVNKHIGDTWFIAADVEFFKVVFDGNAFTNNLGIVNEAWKPDEIGKYFVQIKLPSEFNVTVAFLSETTQVDACINLVDYLDVVRRPVQLSLEYTPEQPTLDDNVTMVASCFDSTLGKPAIDVYVDFLIYGFDMVTNTPVWVYLGWSLTNSSGVALFSFVPREYYESYDIFPWFWIVAYCSEQVWNAEAIAYALVDTRYPTRLEFLGNNVTYAFVGKTISLSCRLVRSDNGDPVPYSPLRVYVNETYEDVFFTDENGILTLDVTIHQSGVYFFREQFCWGEGNYDPLYKDYNNVTFVVVAEVVPVFVKFEVQPKVFKPGTTITLTATVYNATSNLPLSDFWVWFWWYDTSSNGAIGNATTNSDGVASITWVYPMSGVYVFYARVSEAQQMITSPVMLTVGEETQLLMNVKQCTNYMFLIGGKLVSNGAGVGGRQLVVKVNGTVMGAVSTSDNGGYAFYVTLQPENNKLTTYQIEVIFYGDNAINFTLYALTPDNTQYAVCTTLQYLGYKPAANTTILTVEPQATHETTATKTPEEMQQEAQNNGWLKPPEARFSWWYPWFRLHFVATLNGEDIMDVGLSPIGSDKIIIYQHLESWIADAINELIVNPIAKAYCAGWILTEIALFLAMKLGPVGFAIGLAVSIGFKIGFLWTAWNSVEGLKGSFVGTLFSWAYGFITALKRVVDLGIEGISDFLQLGGLDFWKLLLKFIYIPLNMIFLVEMILRVVELGGWQL
jgi:hypothetical protein